MKRCKSCYLKQVTVQARTSRHHISFRNYVIVLERNILGESDSSHKHLGKLYPTAVTQCFRYTVDEMVCDESIFAGKAFVLMYNTDDPETVQYYMRWSRRNFGPSMRLSRPDSHRAGVRSNGHAEYVLLSPHTKAKASS